MNGSMLIDTSKICFFISFLMNQNSRSVSSSPAEARVGASPEKVGWKRNRIDD